MTSSLIPFFEPHGVAVIGASASPEKLSYAILKNMTLYGYKGKVYPVNPREEEILGLKCYPDILQVPDPVDLAVIVLPAPVIPDVMLACGERCIRGVIIITSGFKEVGLKGKILEEKVKAIGKSFGMRIIGPNCVGIINLINGLDATFVKGIPAKGGIGFISQSGAVCGGVIDHMIGSGVGFSHIISLGNEADVDETDVIEYLAMDTNTKVIAAYIENIQRGQKFIQITREVAKDKPVVVLRAGRSDEGGKAISSHTGSLAGVHTAYEAAFRQADAIEVFSISDLLNVSMALDWLIPPSGKGMAIVTNAGGPAALAADNLSAHGLRLASIKPTTQEKMRKKLNPAAQTANPIDLLGGANENEYSCALNMALQDGNVDMVLAILVPQALVNMDKVAEAIVQAAKSTEKPVIACMMGRESINEAQNLLHSNRVPMVDYPEMAGVMFGALYRRGLQRTTEARNIIELFHTDKNKATKLFKKYGKKKYWGESLTREVLAAYKFPLVEGRIAFSMDEAVSIAETLGFPVVAKAISDDILHKTEAGVVRVGVETSEELRNAYKTLIENAYTYNPEAKIEGVMIEKLAPQGEEVIVGFKRDPSFGPLVMFGMGGVFVEIFSDVAFRIAPLTRKEAEEMVHETKAYKLLDGWRGGERYDVEAIYEAILRLSQLGMDFQQIDEMEINPLRVYPQESGLGALVLDCRMILKI